MNDKLNKAYEKALETDLQKEEVNEITVGYKYKNGKMTDEVRIRLFLGSSVKRLLCRIP